MNGPRDRVPFAAPQLQRVAPAVTVAVSVTGVFAKDGLGALVSAVTVGALMTCSVPPT
jgi:hypothetical protein